MVLIERGQMVEAGLWRKAILPEEMCGISLPSGDLCGQKDYRNYYPLEVKDVSYQAANQAGLWYPSKMPGDMIQQGEILGMVKDYNGNILEICRAEYEGVILFQTGSLRLQKEVLLLHMEGFPEKRTIGRKG